MSARISQVDVKQVLKNLATRARRRPSARNLSVYLAVRVSGQDQHTVAANYGISQPRVSVICRQVAQWRARSDARERGEPDAAGRQRLEQWVARQRYEMLYVYALRFLERSQQELLTMTNKFAHGDCRGTDQTTRAQRAEAQWMRLAMRATDRICELAGVEECGADDREVEPDQTAQLVEMLTRLRQAAAREGRVVAGDDAAAAVEAMLRELVGGSCREAPGPCEPASPTEQGSARQAEPPGERYNRYPAGGQNGSAKSQRSGHNGHASVAAAASCEDGSQAPARENGAARPRAEKANITVSRSGRSRSPRDATVAPKPEPATPIPRSAS